VALDPYHQLGVDRDADAATIKQAYRRKAQEAHPDRNPDDPHATTRFQLIQEAYDILGDDERRAAFDQDGTTKKPNGPERAMGMIAGTLAKVFEQADKEGYLADPRFMIVDSLNDALEQMSRAATVRKRGTEGVIAALEAQRKRVKFKGRGQNLILDVLDDQIERARAKLTLHVRDVTDVTAAIEMMKLYEGLPPEDLFTRVNEMQRLLEGAARPTSESYFFNVGN
jgi:curved DNA-binding protein CbpA